MANLNGQQTLQNIQDQIAAILFNRGALSATSYPTTTMVNSVVNKWYKNFVGSFNWEWSKGDSITAGSTISTVQGTARIVMPDIVMDVANINIRGIVQNLPIVTRQKFLAIHPSGWTLDGQGVPQFAVEAPRATNGALQFDLWPTPNTVYSVDFDYFKHIPPLSAGSDIPVIPPEYDTYLVDGPCSEFLIMLGDQRAPYFKQQAEDTSKLAWLDNERMIMSVNTVRGNEPTTGAGLIFPYHGY